MFRFWSSDSRGSKDAAQTPEPDQDRQQPLAEGTVSPVARPLKRQRRDSEDNDSHALATLAKRPRLDERIQEQIMEAETVVDNLDLAAEKIEAAFELQILLKHEEKRLIDARLAKCQAALEQLRRCHLIPFPINCPTPEQMLDVSSGKGHALQRPNEPVPRWAPPFGVSDGPYARHYTNWLIPHPDFDGVKVDGHLTQETSRARGSFAEGRTTRNSFAEPSTTRGRPVRGLPGPRHQALSSGQPQRKEKAGPCVLKRSDGQTVKLVCLDCQRENFSSTQGFINHCRIAHKRDFKSHEEAAMKSGQPYEPVDGESGAGEERAPPVQAPVQAPAPVPHQPGSVNPLARADMTYQEACSSLAARLAVPLQLYVQGKLPLACHTKRAKLSTSNIDAKRNGTHKSAAMTPAVDAPHLSRLMQSRQFSGNLQELVNDAKTKAPLDDITPGEESEDEESSASNVTQDAPQARVPVVKRVPAQSTKSPAPAVARPVSSKGRAHQMSIAGGPSVPDGRNNSDEDVEMEEPSLSPNTLISNNAPSLVSDDGEYDDSDEGSSVSGRSEGLGAESVSDIAEINLDEEHDPRTLRRTSTGVSSAVRLRKEDPKHVSFVNPMANGRDERRKRKA